MLPVEAIVPELDLAYLQILVMEHLLALSHRAVTLIIYQPRLLSWYRLSR